MRLSSFSVVNYRSITNARKIQTNKTTVLVGKNNEGKSNILRALTLAMDIMKMYSSDPRSLRLSANYLKTVPNMFGNGIILYHYKNGIQMVFHLLSWILN